MTLSKGLAALKRLHVRAKTRLGEKTTVSNAVEFVARKNYKRKLLIQALQVRFVWWFLSCSFIRISYFRRPEHRSDAHYSLIKQYLGNLEVFRAFSEDIHKALAEEAEYQVFQDGEVLFFQGDPITSGSMAAIVVR